MPYKSEAQRRYFNSPEGKKKIGKEEVEHWNEVSKGKELPEKVKEENDMATKKILDKAIKVTDADGNWDITYNRMESSFHSDMEAVQDLISRRTNLERDLQVSVRWLSQYSKEASPEYKEKFKELLSKTQKQLNRLKGWK